MNAADVVDAAVHEPVIVFGSPPPQGRDLDLLVVGGQQRLLARELQSRGYVRHGQSFARFDGGRADVVDLVPLESWRLTPDAAAALVRDALPVDGYRHLRRPAPHHALLVLARRLVRSGAMTPKLHERLRSLVTEHPDAWRRAEEEAAGWRLTRELAALRAVAGDATAVPPPRRPEHKPRGALVLVAYGSAAGPQYGEALAGVLAGAGLQVGHVVAPVQRREVVALIRRGHIVVVTLPPGQRRPPWRLAPRAVRSVRVGADAARLPGALDVDARRPLEQIVDDMARAVWAALP